MVFQDYQIMGRTDLCPDDSLTYALTLSVEGDAVLETDSSVWDFEPPHTVVFSQDYSRAIVRGPVTFTTQRSWIVPDLLPGEYERRISVSTSSRSTTPTIVSIPFSIREDCNE